MRHLLWIMPVVGLGCGGTSEPPRPETHPAQGKFFVNGRPASGATVVLHPADGRDFDALGTRPKGTVGEDGSFTVRTYADEDGAPAGEYRVCFYWWENPEAATPRDRLGQRFLNPSQSRWTVRITEGENTLEPIRLQGVARQRSNPARTAPGDSADGF